MRYISDDEHNEDWARRARMAPKDLQAHIGFMIGVNKELHERGELVLGGRAVVSRTGEAGASRQGRPAVTDGIFPESKEFFAGFWIIDVDSPSEHMRLPPRCRPPRRRWCAVEHAD